MKDLTHPLFDEILYYKTLNSTSKKTEQLIRSEDASGNFLVICDQQTGGIGRNDSYWFSPDGGLWFTAALYALPFKSGLTLFSGICVLKALQEYSSEELGLTDLSDLKIKWPNDIYWQEKKMGGLLTNYQDRYKYHIIGIGINTNNPIPEQIGSLAASLKNVSGKEIDNDRLLKKIFDRFHQDFPVFIEEDLDSEFYQKNSFLNNRRIILDTDFEKFTGFVKGINKKGALLLKLDSGMIQPFYSGSVTLLP